MTLIELTEWGSRLLKNAGVSNYKQEVVWVLEENGFTKLQQMTRPELKMNQDKTSIIQKILEKRSKRYPLQYLLKKAHFMDLEFFVDEGVLIPRPETELIVEWAVQKLPKKSRVLEIGSGSGCISISLKHLRPDIEITAVDISETALRISKKNAASLLGTSNSIKFIQSDCFQVLEKEKIFDAILSNPPYLGEYEMQKVEAELHYEPLEALVSGKTGQEIYERIAVNASDYLKSGGKILLECGYTQELVMQDLFNHYNLETVLKDFQGYSRVFIFNLPG